MRSREVSTRVTGLTAHENMVIPIVFFHVQNAQPELRLKPVFRNLKPWGSLRYFVSHLNLGDSKRYGENSFWGCVANQFLGKVTEAFQKIPSRFGAVVKKPGLGVNYPPLATQGLI